MPDDPLGRAMLDHQRGGLRGECVHRDGDESIDARIADHYFSPPAEWNHPMPGLLDRLSWPVLDAGCGAGRHSLWLQEHHDGEVVAIDTSPNAVRAARERGVEDARVADAFDAPFGRDRFGAVLVYGTQAGLAGSPAGLRAFLGELARVTDGDGTAIVDSYDPADLDESFLGYRPDSREGVARRTFHVEYDRRIPEGGRERLVGPSRSFVLLAPDRLAEATIGTPWTVDEVHRRAPHYLAVLEK